MNVIALAHFLLARPFYVSILSKTTKTSASGQFFRMVDFLISLSFCPQFPKTKPLKEARFKERFHPRLKEKGKGERRSVREPPGRSNPHECLIACVPSCQAINFFSTLRQGKFETPQLKRRPSPARFCDLLHAGRANSSEGQGARGNSSSGRLFDPCG